MRDKPLLFIDVDGVLSIWGFPPDRRPPGRWVNVDGILHLLSVDAGGHLLSVLPHFDPVWCTGWEEKADEHLPHALGLPGGIPHLGLPDGPGPTAKRAAIEQHAGSRPLAWIDDALDDACAAWAARRRAPTLLERTDPAAGLTGDGVERLLRWAEALRARDR